MKNIFMLLISTGWVFTLLASCYLVVIFLKNEVYPVIYNSKNQLDSFPYLQVVNILLNISFVWFILVLFGWSIYYLKKNRL